MLTRTSAASAALSPAQVASRTSAPNLRLGGLTAVAAPGTLSRKVARPEGLEPPTR
jgi:hypothetical protein